MTKIVLDRSMIRRLNDLKEQFEVCDEAGKILGRFIPTKTKITVPFSEEELTAFEENLDGRPLAEILKDLRKL